MNRSCPKWLVICVFGVVLRAQDAPVKMLDLASMSVEEKVGQLLFPAIYPDVIATSDDAWKKVQRDLKEFHAGGVHVFRSTEANCTAFIRRAQAAAHRRLLVTADFEGGPGYIVRGTTRFPRGMGLAATGDVELVRRVARATAVEGLNLGVNVNFYPVLDVNCNPKNPIINLRAFGDTPEAVAKFGVAYLKGLQEGGMIATAKHFPGHGDTATDSHLELPIVLAGRDRLDAMELPPFRAAVKAGVQAVMTAHIAWPEVTGDASLPATLSPKILTGILRGELGFDGIVFTDALEMKGLSGRFGMEEAAVRAVAAGADVLLFAQDVPRLSAALQGAVEDGRIPKERLDAAVKHVLDAKRRLAARDEAVVTSIHEGATPAPSLAENRELAAEAVRRSITLVRDKRNRIPLVPDKDRGVLVVLASDGGESREWESPGETFVQSLKIRIPGLEFVELDADGISLAAIEERASKDVDVIVAGYASVSAWRGKTGLTAQQSAGLRRLAEKGALFVGFGNPFGFTNLEDFPTVILAYDLDPLCETLMVEALFGGSKLSGKLPVTIPGLAGRGSGLVR